MSGHSKWATIKRKKGKTDAKRGQLFTKVTKELTLAAKAGGGDPVGNARLRAAIAKAKGVNLPKDKIDIAIRKGTGEEAGGEIYEAMYEGYAPGGVAILVEAATENRNRTVAEIRHMLSKNGGSMGEAGCVAWMFERKGSFSFDGSKYTEDQLLEVGLEAGAEDVVADGDDFEVRTAPEDFAKVQKVFDDKGLEYENAELTMVPKNLVPVDKDAGRRVLSLMEILEDSEDVQAVHVNADFPDDLMQEMEG